MTEFKFFGELSLEVHNMQCTLSFISCAPKVISKIMNETSSGSFCSNDSILQSVMVGLPFGGVGEPLFDI